MTPAPDILHVLAVPCEECWFRVPHWQCAPHPVLNFARTTHYPISIIKEGQDEHSFIKETLAVSFSGLVTLPTDLVTLRLQTQGRERAYKGVADAFVRITKEEGIRAFGKGATSRLASSLLYTPLMSAFGEASKKAVAMLHLQQIDEEEEMTPQHALEVGISALFVSTILTIPENITVKLQFQWEALGEGVYRGPLDCMLKVFKREGAAGLFRGWSSVLLRDVTFQPIFVGGYLVSKPVVERALRPYETAETPIIVYGASVAVGMAASVAVTYPADVVKAHMQTINGANQLTLRQSFRLVYAQYGLRGFYRGLTASAMSGVMSVAGTSLVYFLTLKALD